jgi:hypothetical protein
MVFNTGALAGSSPYSYPFIQSVSGSIITLASALSAAPSVGNAFSIYNYASNRYGTLLGGGTVISKNSTTVVPCSTIAFPSGFFSGGTITFTSGANLNQTRTISQWQPYQATLSTALPYLPSAGDNFYIKAPNTPTASDQTCTGYSNTARFGGFPFIPVPEQAF